MTPPAAGPPPGDGRRAGRQRREDPLGTRALFSAPGAPGADAPPPYTGAPAGPRVVRPARRQLFSGPDLGPRSVIVDCRQCGSRTPIGALGLVRQLVPSLWRPATRYSRYMRCPSCGRFGWCRIDWSVFRSR